MVRQTGNPNYTTADVNHLLLLIENELPLGRDEKPTGTPNMPPHVKKAKEVKLAIDEKANIIEMDDEADED
ncbi:hypothetical protein PHYSODRAFT_366751, partial [Phytophthora sojae]